MSNLGAEKYKKHLFETICTLTDVKRKENAFNFSFMFYHFSLFFKFIIYFCAYFFICFLGLIDWKYQWQYYTARRDWYCDFMYILYFSNGLFLSPNCRKLKRFIRFKDLFLKSIIFIFIFVPRAKLMQNISEAQN